MLFRWDSYPLVRPVLALIVGVFVGEYLQLSLSFGLGVFSFFGVAYFGLHFFISKQSKKCFSVLHLFTLLGAFVSIGIVLTANIQPKERPFHLKNNYSSSILAYQGKIVSEVQEREKSYKFELEVEKIRTEKEWQKTEGKVLVYVKKNEFLDDTTLQKQPQKVYQFGDRLLIKNAPIPTNPPENPSSFDYQKYLKYHYIWYQDFINSYDIVLVKNNSENQSELLVFEKIRKMAIACRSYSDSVLRASLPSKQSYNVAAALFLGIRDGLDNQIKDAYASAGATHVLAVSGLHVGILSYIIGFLFAFLKKNKKTKYIYLLLILSVLFGYAFLTGLSPSVLRASVMFGTIQVGNAFGRRINVQNNLALSALILLLANPYMLFEVGFQLSYLAVFGIVLIQPKISKYWKPSSKIINYFWQLLTVSVAAQLATFPICIYYFHQFPSYFWLSGFVVIPAAVVILGGSIAVVGFSFLPSVVSLFLGTLLSWFIWAVNFLIFWIEKLPFAVIENLRLSLSESLLLYSLLIGILCFISLPKRIFFYFTLLCCLSFVGVNLYVNLKVQEQKRLVFYQIRKGFALSLQEGRRSVTLLDSSSFYNKKAQSYWLTGDLLANGKKENTLINLDSVYQNQDNISQIVQMRDWAGGKIITWDKKTILLWNKKMDKETTFLPQLENIEIVWVGNNAIYNTAALKNLKPKFLVLDDTNYNTRTRLIENEAKVNKLSVVVLKKGAWEREYE